MSPSRVEAHEPYVCRTCGETVTEPVHYRLVENRECPKCWGPNTVKFFREMRERATRKQDNNG